MAYKSEIQKICNEIDDARADVVNAYRSGNTDARVKADRKLADLNYQYYECAGGRVPDDR